MVFYVPLHPTSLLQAVFVDNQPIYSRIRYLFHATTKRLPSAPPAFLFFMEDQKRIFLRMFPDQWITNFAHSGKTTPNETL
jgi:hypothetical protein